MGARKLPSHTSRPSVRRLSAYLAVVALLIAATIAALIVLQPRDAPANVTPAAGEPIITPTPTPTSSPTPTPRESPPPRAAFIGDSYTQGGGAEPDTARWSTLVAAEMGWVEVNFGRGGTGFVTSNSVLGCGLEYCPTYLETVPEVVAAAPGIVVVAGGQNDFAACTDTPDAVGAAVAQTYHGLRAGLPEAQIVAVGPSTPWEVDDVALGFDATVRSAAAAVGATYVSLLEPNVIDPAFVLPDEHVDNRGHRAIADRVVAALSGQR